MDNLNVANAASAINAMLPSEGGDQQDVEMQDELTEVDSAAPEEELQDSDGEQSDEVEAEEEVRFAGVFFIRWRMIKPLH